MALIIEDGTGLPTANAFISLDDADTYHSDRGNAAWAAASEANRNAAIYYATDYINSSFQWRGIIVEDDQALNLPTKGGYDNQGREITGLPVQVSRATAELALVHLEEKLNETLGPRVIEQEVVGAVKRRFSDRSANEGVRYPFLAVMLKGLHSGGDVSFIISMCS